MVDSLLLLNSSMENKGQEAKETENKRLEEQNTKVEIVKSRGRKSVKTSQKKLPQRGLGVAQLERLRMQERWKKMSENDQVQAQTAQNHHHQFQFFPFFDQQNEVLDPFARFAQVNNGIMNSSQPSSQAFAFQPYSGFPGGTSGGSGGHSLFSGQYQVDRLRIASQELSSTQKMHCVSDYCEICLKKKRIIGENSGFNGGRAQYTEKMMPMDDCDFLGLNLGRNSTVDGLRGVRRACYSGLTVDEEVEVVAVHRKGKSVGGSVLMEYEFFPRKGSSSSSSFHNDSSITEAAGAAVMGEASSSNTNLIDLSLKLSC